MARGGPDYSNVSAGGAVNVDLGYHHTTHENGGLDEVNVDGLSGVLGDGQDAATLQTRALAATAPANQDVIGWNAASGQWEPQAATTPAAHAASHEDGGSDEINVAALSGKLANAQKLGVTKNSGGVVGTRPELNFIEGTNITLTVADDAVGDKVDVTIDAVSSPSFIGCRVYNNANQSIAAGAWRTLYYNSEHYDTDNMHSTSVSTHVISAQTAGYYLITLQVRWSVQSGGTRGIWIINNVLNIVARLEQQASVGENYDDDQYIQTVIYMNVGDTVVSQALQTSSATPSIIYAAAYSPIFSASFLGS